MVSFEHSLRVRYAETDQMGVVYHGHFAAYFETARAEFIRSRGLTYRGMEEKGIMMPVTELNLKFMRPALYDDLLTIRTTVHEIPDKRINLHHEVFNEKGELLVTGHVSLAFLDAATRRSVRAPDFFVELFSELKPEA